MVRGWFAFKKKSAGLFLAAVILILGSHLFCLDAKVPQFGRDPRILNESIRKAVRSYHRLGIDFTKNLIDYKPFESYLHFENTPSFSKPNFPDDQGIPLVKYGAHLYYNPVTVSQYALYLFGKYRLGQASIHQFVRVVDKLISLQAADGAFRFTFAWHYYLTGREFKPGWVSGMAQGQALSVFARAYALTRDRRYWDAGNKALGFLLTPVTAGGVMDTLADLNPAWRQYITFEQYPVKPASYTLNGFMFALLGCYDWWQLEPAAGEGSCKMALVAFAAGIKTLNKILKYYDVGGFASYDLGYIIYQAKPNLDPFYFSVDIYLLHALHSITGDETLAKYESLWASYVGTK
ncbi:MAG TPA: hypothetical protein DDW50_14345 [Firmicutes bacterium]|jgi:heparosan-N-sulfate-glucuronate 5-epimerase|nr:hypothetical protein [Bacillota bacterium]